MGLQGRRSRLHYVPVIVDNNNCWWLCVFREVCLGAGRAQAASCELIFGQPLFTIKKTTYQS